VDAPTGFERRSVRQRTMQAAIVLGLGLLSVVFLLPLLWMVSTSLKPLEETMKMPPDLLPIPPQWSNYPAAISAMGRDAGGLYFWRYLGNTLTVVALGTLGTLLSCSAVAYAFAFLQWPGRNLFFWLTVGTMMVPFPVLMVPLYGVFRELGWIGTLLPLWLPAWFGSAWNIFLMRQFFLGIPKDLLDAARIDGCSEIGIWWRVVLPLASPVLVVVGLFHAIGAWNDFLGPLLFLTRQETFTLSLGLQFYQSQHGGTEWHYLMAASTLMVLPVLVLFLLAQRTLIRGITMTGIKM
jgi:multiple sugar transport system permease protein